MRYTRAGRQPALQLHSNDLLDRIARLLRSDAPATLVLTGDTGSGRSLAVEESLRRLAGPGGRPVTILSLDLDGYEPADSSLQSFLDHRRRTAGLKPVATLHQAGCLDWWHAAALAVNDGTDLPLARNPSPEGNGAALFLERLATLTCDAAGVLVVHDADLLPRPFVAPLITSLEGGPRIRCVLMSTPGSDWEWLREVIGNGLHYISPPRVGTAELELTLERGFGLEAPAAQEMARSLCKSSGGLRGLVALKLRRMMVGMASEPTPLPGGERAGGGGKGAAPPAPLLSALALCGGTAPARPVLAALGIPETEGERWIDLLDDWIAEGAPGPSVIDHQYHHPSFPAFATYQLAGRLNAAELVAAQPAGTRGREAGRLLDCLVSQLPGATRGEHRLLLALAVLAGRPTVAEQCRAGLRSWAGQQEAEDLPGLIRALLAAAAISHRAGELGNAREHLQHALELVAGEGGGGGDRELRLLRAAAFESLGNVLLELDLADSAQPILERSLDEYRSLPEHELRIAAVLRSLGDLAWSRGDLATARSHLRGGVEVLEHPGSTHLQELTGLLGRLAELERAAGEPEACLAAFERLIAARSALYGDSAPEVLATHRASADAALELNRLEGARKHLEKAVHLASTVEITEKDLTTLLKNLVDVLRRLDRPAEAVSLMKWALEIDRRRLGEPHHTLVIDLYVVATLLHASGDPEGARRRLEEAFNLAELVLPERDEGWSLLRQARAALPYPRPSGGSAPGAASRRAPTTRPRGRWCPPT